MGQCANEMLGGVKRTDKSKLTKGFDFEAYVALGGHRKHDCRNDCIDDNCPSSLDTSSADDCKSDCTDCCSGGDDCDSDSFDRKYGDDDDDDDDDDGDDDDDDDDSKSKMDNKARCRQKCEKEGLSGDELFDCEFDCDNPSADIMCFTECMAATPF